MPPIPTRHDKRVQRLRSRLSDKDGARPRLRMKLLRAKERQRKTRERKRPVEVRDAQFDTEAGRLQRDLQFQQSDIAGRREATEQRYGFGNQANPFSVAAQLERDYRTRRGATLGSYARRGQLYSGALSQRQALDRRGFEQGLDVAQREYQSELGDLTRSEQEAQRGLEEGLSRAEVEAMERYLEKPPEPGTPSLKPKIKALRRRLRKRRKNR